MSPPEMPRPHICPASKPSRNPHSPQNHPDTPVIPPEPPRPPLSPRTTSSPYPSPCSQGGSGSGRWSHHRPPRGGRGSSAGTQAQSSQRGNSHCSRAQPSQGGKHTLQASGDSWGCTLSTPVLPLWGTGCAGKGLCKQGSTKHLPQRGVKVLLVVQPTPGWLGEGAGGHCGAGKEGGEDEIGVEGDEDGGGGGDDGKR